MFAGRLAEAAAISVLATIVTAVIAAPVLRAPSERVFGMEIVGRHHDPFTVMQQFERPIAIGVYTQPVTDIAGALLARLSGAVAAYNWLVLLSFPLSAAAAYLLARHLTLSPAGATVAAMAYAFSPFHLAHAAYHPHIAQTQWVPLYLLALWRCLDKASPAAVGFLGAAAIAVTLSNFYAGMIMAVITPVALAAYWFCRANRQGYAEAGATNGSRAGWASPSRASRSSPLSGMAYASYTAARRGRKPRGLRVRPCRPVPLQREMVELSRSAGRTPAVRRGRAAHLECRRRQRRAARTTGEPRLGNHRAWARRLFCLARRSSLGEAPRTTSARPALPAPACPSSSSSLSRRCSAPCRRSERLAHSRSSGLPHFFTRSCRCSAHMHASGSSCS